LCFLLSSYAFVCVPQTPSPVATQVDTRLHMAQSIPSSKERRTAARKPKTASDRTPEEFQSLIRDLLQTAIDAGPQAGPARTMQAYMAVRETAREFLLPRPGKPAQSISFPKVLRSLFEKMGATYIKLGQFIASSPTIFPKDYVLEFQKCLDATDPLDWSVIENVIVNELGPISNTFEFVDKTPLASASIAQVGRRIK
jgi:aarF domain-containing kinase